MDVPIRRRGGRAPGARSRPGPGANARRNYRRRRWAASPDAGDVGGLLALGSGDHVELDPLALGQGAEAVRGDRREVHEHVLAGVGGQEAEALGVVEPLDRALHPTLAGAGLGARPRRVPGPAIAVPGPAVAVP